MITSVAELAFRCLQPEKDWRPTMDEVLIELKGIAAMEKDSNKATNIHDYAWLPKRMRPEQSPVSVMQKWASRSNTSASLPTDTRLSVVPDLGTRHSVSYSSMSCGL
ncbi:hypothetical protein MLD38_005479 [Melastoma candidum]|uniref:Uncharacterized protein n=1 Tax=Melastoma candidum TaxID=119954 RepID=A0ACB9RNZ1_9MYRT|nr:hypothetical protein MLD38_005479 [Melastoma candidum]